MTQTAEGFFDCARKLSKTRQNSLETEDLFPNVRPTMEQQAIINQQDSHLIVSGSAGSGKSLTLLGRLIRVLEQNEEPKRILYVSYSPTLVSDAKKRLYTSDKYITLKDNHIVHLKTYHWAVYDLLREIGLLNVASPRRSVHQREKEIDRLCARITILKEKFENSGEYKQFENFYSTHDAMFLLDEFFWMKGNGFVDKEKYFQVERTGRSNNPRLTKEQRATVFRLFEIYNQEMKKSFNGDLDPEDYALLLHKYSSELPSSLKYDHIFVDEFQDLQPMQIMTLVSLSKQSITLVGDQKQRIYKRSPYSFAGLNLNIAGNRSRKLKENFRSTKQTMKLASSLEFSDTENDREDDQIFIREGEKPEIRYYNDTTKLGRFMVKTIKTILVNKPEASIAVVHRYTSLETAQKPKILQELELNFSLITTDQYRKRFNFDSQRKPIYFTDAFSAKGLEFDYVFVIQFDNDHYPHKQRVKELMKQSEKTQGDTYDKDYNAILNDEKKVLYVAMTRAKEKLWLLYNGERYQKISPFIRDFDTKDYIASNFRKTVYSKDTH